MADIKNINGKNIKDATARNDIANLKTNSHSHSNKTILDTITQEKINSWNSDKTTFNDFTIEQTATEKILKFKGVEIFRCSLQVPGSSGATTYSVTYNLSNCSSDVKTSSITSGSSYSAIITANSGYTMSSITVTMGGTNITSTVVSGNRISIPNVTGAIVITATASVSTPTTYTVTNNLTNCSSNNNSNTVNANHSYEAILSPNSNYEMSSITVTMGGVDITGAVVSGTNINISSVTGNVVITAVAILSSSEDINNDITILGSNIYVPSKRGTINLYENGTLKINTVNGDRIYFTINNLNLEDNTDYKFSCSFDQENSTCFESLERGEVYTGGIEFQNTDTTNYNDISFTFNSRNWSTASKPSISCAIHGTSVVGIGIFKNIKITKISEIKKYVITNELTNVTNNNINLTEIEENQFYTATITANSGYTINTITVTMGGVNITSQVVSGNVINIPSVTGDIVITATGTVQTRYSITNNLSHCLTNNVSTVINKNGSYNATISANSGYTISSITVTMGGTDITSQAVSGANISISSVTGDIVITATAVTSGGNVTPEPGIPDSEEYQTYLNEMNNNYTANQQYAKEDEAGAYVIPLSTYSISNDGTNANATTQGINNALKYAKNNNYSKVKLPAGTYLIDSTVTNSNELTDSEGNTWTSNSTGVYVPSNITLIMEGATLKLEPVENPQAHVISLSKSDNAKIIGGTIIGDRENHDYGMRINNNGGELERGGISTSTGANTTETDCIRTKDFITNYVDWFSKSSSSLPSKFHITPLWNTTRNTVDGSEVIVYFYDSNNNLVSTINGDFLKEFATPSGATKMKFVIKQETRLDAVLSITTRSVHYTYEFGSGIFITASNNVTIRGVKIYDCTGDCICTNAPPIKTAICNDLVIENCTLENSRRQGISFVATGDRPIVRNCNIGRINGVDPQCGIDFEHYDHVDGGIIEGCNFYNNKKWDIINYNGTGVTIKNNYFNGSLAFTYGYNMDVYNNKFLFKDHNVNNIYKSYNEIMYFNQWGNSFEEKNAYYNVHDNVFIGYNAGYNNTSALSNTNNHYKNNTFINCNWLRMQYTEANTFKNCTIEYIFDSDKTLDACTFTNCTLYKRPGHTLNTSNCTLNNSTVKELTSTSTTPTSISIPSTFSIKQGESKTIPVMIMPTTALTDGEPLTKEVRWESSDWSKVYVSEIGTVYAIGNPEGVTITCASRVNANARGTCTLTLNTSTVEPEPEPGNPEPEPGNPEPEPGNPVIGGNIITINEENINIPSNRGTLASYENNNLTINTVTNDRVYFTLIGLDLEDDTDYIFSCSLDEENSTCYSSKTRWEVYTSGIAQQYASNYGDGNYDNISLEFNSKNWSTATKPLVNVAVQGTIVQGVSIFKDIKIRRKSFDKYYSVTYNLSNSNSTNIRNYAKENSMYNTIISPNNGYSINSITVTMGTTNITSQVVSHHNINITNVTGNVVINAEAIPTVISSDDEIYTVDLAQYNISNDNTNAINTTNGINRALADAKTAGYKRVKLPEGIYSIDTSVKNTVTLNDGTDTWPYHRQGIAMQSDMELILEGSVLQMIPCEDPYYSILTIGNCINSKITGGTILGDRETHDYGMRINENGNMFESGDFDSTTGEPIDDDTRVRTKDFISVYKDWFTKDEESLPNEFYITPLWNTTMNTVDGGCRFIHCYDKDNNYLGLATGGIGYIKQATLLPNTSKIKISIKNEKRLDILLAMTKRTVYYTYEFGCGVTIADSKNIELNGLTIKDCIGDCICTIAAPIKVTVDNLKIANCTLENSRRQGISFVATGENYIVQNCNIGKINGVDPQSGIDFEHYDYVKNTTIDGCNFYDNKKWDIINYNGTEIEIKNSNFTGAIATTYGHTMDVHHNKFEYKDSVKGDKIYKDTSLILNTKNNIVHDNEFIGGNAGNYGENTQTYNNKFKNLSSGIITNGANKYYNCYVEIEQNDTFAKLGNNYFENCDVTNKRDDLPMEINNCTFKNSSYNPRGTTKVVDCTFNMVDKSIMSGFKMDTTVITYNRCTINSTYTKDTKLFGNLKAMSTFENCNFNISRYTLALNYGTLTFNGCDFIFNDLNSDENTVGLNASGYGFVKCPWYFNDCRFESNLPVDIYGGNVVNCETVGNIRIS